MKEEGEKKKSFYYHMGFSGVGNLGRNNTLYFILHTAQVNIH